MKRNLKRHSEILNSNMTKKEFKATDKKGRKTTWEWEETPEVRAALERLHTDIKTRIEEEKNDS